MSGQAINFQKSGIFFSANVRRDKQNEISEILGVHNYLRNSKYLGLPSLIGRSKKSVFNFVKERGWQRTQGWINKMLSRGGKAVLLKAYHNQSPLIVCHAFFFLSRCVERLKK